MLSAVTFCFIWLYVNSNAQFLQTPCPDVFQYQMRNDSTDRWYGLINLVSSEDVAGMELGLTLDGAALKLGEYSGVVTTHDNKKYKITNQEFRLKRKVSYLLRFFVKYDASRPIPKLIKIKQNGRTICAETVYPVPKPFTPAPANFSKVLPEPPGQKLDDEIQCGTISAQGGKLYPWHAFVYGTGPFGLIHTFQCSASLITKQHLLTTGNCVAALNDIRIHLGKDNLNDNRSSRVQIRKVSDKIVQTTAGFDLAVLKLESPVELNDFVRPVCLWEGGSNYEDIIGNVGTVVGTRRYGNFLNPQSELAIIRIAAVPRKDCTLVYPFRLNEVNYCTLTQDAATCVHDVGAGMVLLQQYNGREAYQLRGILIYKHPMCVNQHYGLYSNIPAYLDFIKGYLR